MNILLAQNALGYSVSEVSSVNLNWIGQLIRILIEGIGIIGVGIIVFTLILKCIVLPLDIFSRIQGKKQALIMERMRPQMEKLQQQYANDKSMYNQKVMELQKKSGYSMLGSCLPMIVSLVIFIVVFQAFSTYSQYANVKSYNELVRAYNGVVNSYVIDDSVTDNTLPGYYGFLTPIYDEKDKDKDGEEKKIVDYEVDFARFAAHYNFVNESTLSEDDAFLQLAQKYKKNHSEYESAFEDAAVNMKGADDELTDTACAIRITLVSYYMEEPAALAVKEYYKEHNNSFLWVRNLWYPDSAFTKELPSFSNFKSSVSKANISSDYAPSYAKVTAALGAQKNHVNGYFVLIVLSIGLMLLQQFISMRSNKSVNDLSTVDGTGARTNKMMMVMMPLIYGVFAFMYSASFSIYMITNTVFGILTTLLINKLVDVWFKKKEAEGKLDEILNKRSKKKAKKAKNKRK